MKHSKLTTTVMDTAARWRPRAVEFVRSQSFAATKGVANWESVPLSFIQEFPGVSWDRCQVRLVGRKLCHYHFLLNDFAGARELMVNHVAVDSLYSNKRFRIVPILSPTKFELVDTPSEALLNSGLDCIVSFLDDAAGAESTGGLVAAPPGVGGAAESSLHCLLRYHRFLNESARYQGLRERLISDFQDSYVPPQKLGVVLGEGGYVSFNFYRSRFLHALALGQWSHCERLYTDYRQYREELPASAKSPWAEYCQSSSTAFWKGVSAWMEARGCRVESKRQRLAESAIMHIVDSTMKQVDFAQDRALYLKSRGKVFYDETCIDFFPDRLHPYLFLTMVIRIDLGVDLDLCTSFNRHFGVYFDTMTHLAEKVAALNAPFTPLSRGFVEDRKGLYEEVATWIVDHKIRTF